MTALNTCERHYGHTLIPLYRRKWIFFRYRYWRCALCGKEIMPMSCKGPKA